MARRQQKTGTTEKVIVRGLFLLMAVVGVLAILHFSDIYKIPAFREAEPEPEPVRASLPEGTVLVPAASRGIKAYSRVSGTDLFNLRSGRWTQMPLPKERAEAAGVLLNRKQIIGRVLKRDKPSGRVFTEDDFFPKGTRPGITAGIPPGMRAVRIEASRIRGLHGLARGDSVDLIYSFPVDSSTKGTALPQVSGPRGAELAMAAHLSSQDKQSTVRIAARGAIIVQPVSVREMPVTSSTLSRGTVTRSRPIQEVVLAMKPEEAVALTAALETEAQIVALPLSGRSDDPGDSETPELEPHNPFATGDGEISGVRVIEMIGGRDKKVIAVPGD